MCARGRPITSSCRQVMGFRDPYIIEAGGGAHKWRIVLGSGIAGAGGALLVYASPELTSGANQALKVMQLCVTTLVLTFDDASDIVSPSWGRKGIGRVAQGGHTRVRCACTSSARWTATIPALCGSARFWCLSPLLRRRQGTIAQQPMGHPAVWRLQEQSLAAQRRQHHPRNTFSACRLTRTEGPAPTLACTGWASTGTAALTLMRLMVRHDLSRAAVICDIAPFGEPCAQ